VAGFGETPAECVEDRRRFTERAGAEESNYRKRLLRARCERPRDRRAADQFDESAPPHGAYPQGQGAHTQYSRFGGSVACIAAKAGQLMSDMGHKRRIAKTPPRA